MNGPTVGQKQRQTQTQKERIVVGLNKSTDMVYLLGVKTLFDMGNLEHRTIQLPSLHFVKWPLIHTLSQPCVCANGLFSYTVAVDNLKMFNKPFECNYNNVYNSQYTRIAIYWFVFAVCTYPHKTNSVNFIKKIRI